MLANKFSLVVFLVGSIGVLSHFLLEPLLEKWQVCENSSLSNFCFGLFYGDYVQSFALFSAALTLISFFLFFTNKRVYRAWLIFTLFSFAAYTILVFITPVTNGFLQPQRDMASLVLSAMYGLASIILIAFKSWQIKKTKSTR